MRRLLPLLTALMLAGCGKDPEPVKPELECDGKGPEQVLVARTLLFSRVSPEGVTNGFDLDGTVSGSFDPASCHIEDFSGLDGEPGVDNSMAKLLPLLEQTEAAVLEPLIQDSVNGGSLLLMFSLTDLDGTDQDECVEVDVFKGLGIPMIGNDGRLLPNQTLDINPDTAIQPAPTGSFSDGRMDVGPIDEVVLTIVVLDLNAEVVIHDVMLRFEPQQDGTWTGMMGGGVDIQALIDVATLQNVSDEVAQLMLPLLDTLADLAPDENGDCTQISVTLEFEAVPAFVYE